MTKISRIVAAAFLLSATPMIARAAEAAGGAGTGGFPSMGAAVGGWSYAGLLSLDIPPSGFSVGPRLAGEVMYGFMDLGNGLRLDLGGRASFAYHSRSQTIALTNVGGHIWSLDFVPDGKILYGINDKFAVYGDFGLGLAYLDQTAEATGVPTASSSSVQLTIQFGGGVSYAISPTMNLLGEIRINVYTGSGTGTFFALPTVGVQWH